MTDAPSPPDGRAILAGLWHQAGGDPSALQRAVLTGDGPVLPSSFRVAEAAQAAIAACGLAATEAWRRRGGAAQEVAVERRHAAAEFRSERYLTIDGAGPGSLWDAVAGLYRAGDGRHVRLHTNFPAHRDAVCDLLGCFAERGAVTTALQGWGAIDFETAAHRAGAVVAALRTRQEWSAEAQGRAVAGLPLVAAARIGDAAPRPLPGGDRPLAGLRVLDLTRIIAGPVAGRALAAHGATVMRIAAPHLPFIDWAVKDTGRGKLSAFCDLDTAEGRHALARLVADADVVLDAYRPGALEARGFGAAALAALRPGLVHVRLSAWGAAGPWAGRRGFDSLVQAASGFNHAEGLAAGRDGPLELPCQALDHGAGYIMATAAILTRLRQAAEGGSWSVDVSLARTGDWLWSLGRVEEGFVVADQSRDDIADLIESAQTPFGTTAWVGHAARLSETPARWDLPAVPLGTHEPAWPA